MEKMNSGKPSTDGGESGTRTSLSSKTLHEKHDSVVRRKLDMRLLPVLSIMYFFHTIDRSDLGYAMQNSTQKATINVEGNQYFIILGLYYLGFCLFVLPTTILQRFISAKVMLPTLMVGWGAMTMLQSATSSWGGLAATQFFLGVFQAGFLACLIVYLSTFYKRNELAFRIAMVYGSATIAGSFNSLISYAIFKIDSSLSGWKLLFIIEGAITILLAAVAFWALPRDIATCSWFTQDEKIAAEQRMLQDGSSIVAEPFSLASSLASLLNWHALAFATIGLFFGAAASSAEIAGKQMLATMSMSETTLDFNYIAMYVSGCIVLLMVAASSDFYRERSTHIAGTMMITLFGLINLTTVYYIHMRASALFCAFALTAGAFTPCVFHAWYNNNTPDENSRVAMTGLMVGAVNIGGVISLVAFQGSTEATSTSSSSSGSGSGSGGHTARWLGARATTTTVDDLEGLKVAAAFQGIALLMVFAYGAWMRFDNRRRDRLQGMRVFPEDIATSTLVGGFKDASWRWTA